MAWVQQQLRTDGAATCKDPANLNMLSTCHLFCMQCCSRKLNSGSQYCGELCMQHHAWTNLQPSQDH